MFIRYLTLLTIVSFLSACGGGSSTTNNPPPPRENQAPVVDAGASTTIRLPTDTVSLDGTVTDDGLPSGASVSTVWTVQSGPDGAVFADPNAVDTTVTFVNEGTYELLLTADDTALQGSDTVQVIVEAASAPTANAGGPYAGIEGTPVVLDGSGSSDPDNDITDYDWDLDNDGAFDDATVVNPTFSAASSGDFTIGLRVTDADGATSTDTTTVTVANVAPTADAGGPYSGGQVDIPLTGSASSDPGNDIVSYEWDLDNDGTYETPGVNVVFNRATTGTFTVGLRVTDDDGASSTDTATVTVSSSAPVADAGGPYSGDQGTDITLDASGSSDPSGIASYEWDLDNDSTYETLGVNATFNSAAAGVFTVGLRVTDNDGDTATTLVDVTVNDIAPAAPVGLTALADSYGEVSLDWDDNTEPDFAGYVVRRSTTPGGPYTDFVSPRLVASDYVDTTGIVNGTTYYYVVTAEDGVPNVSDNSAEVEVTPPPVHAYWTFDEGAGTTTADTVPPDDGTGTINGATWTAGVSGSALDFNGTSDDVVIDNTQSLNITGRAVSLHAWLFPRSGETPVVGESIIISKRTDAGGSDVFAMALSNYRLVFRLDGQDMISSHIVVLNEWVHVAMVYDGTDMRIYVNGVLDAATPVAKSDPIDASSRAVHLGKREEEGRFFDGVIDEVQIYESAEIPGPKVPPARGAGLFFEDITLAAGTSGPADGGQGVMFAEVDNDSLPDYYLTNALETNSDRPDFFFDNTNGAVFDPVAAAIGIDDIDGGSHGAVWADLDNDGDYDLVNGSTWDNATPSRGNPASDNVFENRLNEVFADFDDVTPTIPDILANQIETRGITAFDMDGDGDLDLFSVPSSFTPELSLAFRNDGNFAFSSHAGGALTTAVAMQGVTDTDYDGDGDIDILAANRAGEFAILNNDGTGFFTRILPGLDLGITDGAGDGITTADVDNDGDLDLLLASNTDGNAYLYIRRADGGYDRRQAFEDINGYMGGFADLDNDGDLDLVFAGDERVYLNDGSGTFSSGQSVPVSELGEPRAIAFADIDGDGDLDFAITAIDSRNWLVRNDFDSGNSLRVKLVSPNGQVGAFGAKVWVRPAGDPNTLIGMREAKGNTGYLAQDDPVLHFGLGSATVVDVFVDFVECPDGTAPIERLSVDASVTPRIEISGDVCPAPPP